MKTKSAIKRLCKSCKIVKRRGRNFVICKKNPRHKQRQGFHTTTWAASIRLNDYNNSQVSACTTFEGDECNVTNIIGLNVSGNMTTTLPQNTATNFCVYGLWLPVANMI